MFRHVTTRLSGLVILVAGLWGGLIPFLGPWFHFTLGPDHAWRWTTGRLWLDVIPAAVAVVGGVILMGGGPRLSGRFGALIALAAGIWFAVGPDVSRLWNHGLTQQGATHGRHVITRVLEVVTLHTGLGVLIVAFAAYALPGATAYAFGRRRAERDAAIAGTGAAAGAAEAHHRDRVAAREGAVGAGVGAGAGTAAPGESVASDEADGTAVREPYAARESGHNGDAVAEPANRHTMTRRRGGLAGFFSRR